MIICVLMCVCVLVWGTAVWVVPAADTWWFACGTLLHIKHQFQATPDAAAQNADYYVVIVLQCQGMLFSKNLQCLLVYRWWLAVSWRGVNSL